jgi:hypothetical protein
MNTTQLFFFLPYSAVLSWWIYRGIKRQENLTQWIPGIGITILSYLLGSLVINKLEPETESRIIPSIFAGVAFIISKKLFGWKKDINVELFVPVLLFIAVKGIEEFYLGTSFGATTDLPWGVSYDSNSPAYFYQHAKGLIAGSEATALKVHPVSLYVSIASIFAVLVIVLFAEGKKFNSTSVLAGCVLIIAGNLYALSTSISQPTKSDLQFLSEINMHHSFYILSGVVLILPFRILKNSLKWKLERFIKRHAEKTSTLLLCGLGAFLSVLGRESELILVAAIQLIVVIGIIHKKSKTLQLKMAPTPNS